MFLRCALFLTPHRTEKNPIVGVSIQWLLIFTSQARNAFAIGFLRREPMVMNLYTPP